MTSNEPASMSLQKIGNYKNTKLKHLTLEQIEPDESHYTARAQDRTLTTNYQGYGEKLAKKLKIKVFIMDDEDITWFKEDYDFQNEGDEPAVTRSLTKFMSKRPEKTIYMRTFYLTIDGYRNEFLLTDDILEIVPLVWKKQRNEDFPLSAQGIVEKYCGNHENQNEQESMVSVRDFESMLEEMDIDKSLITLVVDFDQLRHVVSSCSVFGMGWFYFLNHHGEYSMFYCKALQGIFQTLVCGINWTVNLDRKALPWRRDYKNEILKLMNKYSSRHQSSQLLERSLHSEVGSRTSDLFYKNCMKRLFQDHACFLRNADPNSEVNDSEYASVCRKFALPNLRKLKSEIPLEDVKLVFMTRIFYALGFMERFLDGRNEHLKKLLLDGFFDLAPPRTWEHLRRFFNHKYGTNYKVVDSLPMPSHGDDDSEVGFIDEQVNKALKPGRINKYIKNFSKSNPLPKLCLNDVVDKHDENLQVESSNRSPNQVTKTQSEASVAEAIKQRASEEHGTTSTNDTTAPEPLEAKTYSKNSQDPAKLDDSEAENVSKENRKLTPDTKQFVHTFEKQGSKLRDLTQKEKNEQGGNLIHKTKAGTLSQVQQKSTARCSLLEPSNHCNQCYENLGKRKKAEEELKKSEKMAKQNESQAMKYQQLVKDYAKLEKKLESVQKVLGNERTAKEQALKQAAKTKKVEDLEKENKALRQQLKAQAEQINQEDEALKKMKDVETKFEKQKELSKKLSHQNEIIACEYRKLEQQCKSHQATIAENKVTIAQNKITIAQNKVTIDEMKMQRDDFRNAMNHLISRNDVLEKEAENSLMNKSRRSNQKKRVPKLQSQNKPPLTSTSSTSSSLTECSNSSSSAFPSLPPSSIRPTIVRPSFNQNTFDGPSTSSATLPAPASSPENLVLEETNTEELECGICLQPIVDEQPQRCNNEKCSFIIHKKCIQTWMEVKKEPFLTRCVHCTLSVVDDKEFPKL
ncbi:unnamed protein product [Caenorhabditis brenneri]